MLQYKADNLIAFSYKLSQMHKSALPNAVRFTLTDAAKDIKFKTLKRHADIQFDVKKASFFRAYSAYEPAKGWKISNMESKAGMIKGSNPNSTASTDIGKQQTAGIVRHKSYIATKGHTLKGLKKPIVTTKRNYFDNAIKAMKENVPLIVKKNNKGYIVRINKIDKKINAGSDLNPIKTEIFATYGKNRGIQLTKKRPFLNNAALESARGISSFYVKNAKRQFEKLKYK